METSAIGIVIFLIVVAVGISAIVRHFKKKEK